MTSEDFQVGQRVVCVYPEHFLQPLRSYLKDREGEVIRVYPAKAPDAQYCGWTNRVEVLWGKRNGRGKEQKVRMHPTDITPKP